MTTRIVESYEAKYNTLWADATEEEQKIWSSAWESAIKSAVSIVEAYRVSVGNSPAGELAAKWTMQNLQEIRDELHEMVS